MRAPPQNRRLGDGRLHLHDGPIDLIVEAFGDKADVERAYQAGWERFADVLDELCAELPLLRMQLTAESLRLGGRVACRMTEAVAPFAREVFITPMAAVAGAVAEEILEAMTKAARLDRAYVNNGGDIALHLLPGERFRIGMIDRPDWPGAFGRAEIDGGGVVRGVATSGWRGRSFSFGIADAVTVLAVRASTADAAATLIANAVDLPGHRAILRAPASQFDPQSDLGDRLVTRDVGALNAEEIDAALTGGWRVAERLREAGYIVATALHLRGQTRLCADDSGRPLAPRSGRRVRDVTTFGWPSRISAMPHQPSSVPSDRFPFALRGEGKRSVSPSCK